MVGRGLCRWSATQRTMTIMAGTGGSGCFWYCSSLWCVGLTTASQLVAAFVADTLIFYTTELLWFALFLLCIRRLATSCL